jgi:SAM-dependent methyltransferase
MEKHDIYNWGPLERLKSYIQKYGLRYTLEYSMEKIFSPILHIYYKKFKRPEKFIFEGKSLEYFYHKYRSTWANERIVEIPIFKEMLNETSPENTLEVGNVLSHYFEVKYDILDKYENLPNIIQEDILSFMPEKKYKLIISISTFEHIGWDENPRNPEKVKDVIAHIKCLLKDGGRLVFSVPVNYNPELDKMIFSGEINLEKKIYLKRTDKGNHWLEVNEKDILHSKYGNPYFCANALIIGFIKN